MRSRGHLLVACTASLLVAASVFARGNYDGVRHWFASDVPTVPVHMERLDDTFDDRLTDYIDRVCDHIPREVGTDYNLDISARIVIFPDGTRSVRIDSNDPPRSLRVACVQKVLEGWPAAPTRFPVFTEWGTYLTSTSEGGCTRWDPPCLQWFSSTSCPPGSLRECENCLLNICACSILCTVGLPTWIPIMWRWGVNRTLEPFIGPPDYTDRRPSGFTKDTTLWPIDPKGEARPTVSTHGLRQYPRERAGMTVSDAVVVGSIDASVVQEFVRGFAGEFGVMNNRAVPVETRFTLTFDVEPNGLVYIVRTPEPEDSSFAYRVRTIFRSRRFPYNGEPYTVSMEIFMPPHVEERRLPPQLHPWGDPASVEPPSSGGSPDAVPY